MNDNIKRFSLKLFAVESAPFELDALIPVFHHWIQLHSLSGLLIDVADYRHVPDGPAILLVGHEADYAFDLRGGQPGLALIRKQPLPGTLTQQMRVTFEHLAAAARLLESETTLNGIRFDPSVLEITFLDRLNAPNRAETVERLRPYIQVLAANPEVPLESVEADPRKSLRFRFAPAAALKEA